MTDGVGTAENAVESEFAVRLVALGKGTCTLRGFWGEGRFGSELRLALSNEVSSRCRTHMSKGTLWTVGRVCMHIAPI